MPRDGLSCGAPVSGGKHISHMGNLITPAADIKERSHDGAYHVPQKAVGGNREYQIVPFPGGIAHYPHMVRGISFPSGLEDGAYRSLVASARLFEAAEVVSAEKHLAGLVHRLHIQRKGIEIRIMPDERILLPVNKVVVSAEPGVEAGMEAGSRNFHFVNSYGNGQNGI